MASAIVAGDYPENALPVSKATMRANWNAAKNEIEAIQAVVDAISAYGASLMASADAAEARGLLGYAPVGLISGATVAWDVGAAPVASLILTQNATLNASNIPDSCWARLAVQQDLNGGWTLTLGTGLQWLEGDQGVGSAAFKVSFLEVHGYGAAGYVVRLGLAGI